MLEVKGSPIGGENPPHEQVWRARVAQRARGLPVAAAVGLHFELEPHRRNIDLDNLVRPALAGLRDAAVFSRGFPELHVLVATKRIGSSPGLAISFGDEQHLRAVCPPGESCLAVTGSVLPRDGDRSSKSRWRAQVESSYAHEPLGEPAWIDIAVNAGGSLEELMKPIIDGLEPFLGRDQAGRLEFTPNDHLVTWLRISRQPELASSLTLRAGKVERAI